MTNVAISRTLYYCTQSLTLTAKLSRMTTGDNFKGDSAIAIKISNTTNNPNATCIDQKEQQILVALQDINCNIVPANQTNPSSRSIITRKKEFRQSSDPYNTFSSLVEEERIQG